MRDDVAIVLPKEGYAVLNGETIYLSGEKVVPEPDAEPPTANEAAAAASGAETWAKLDPTITAEAHKKWMSRAHAGDFEGVHTPATSFVPLRATVGQITENPRLAPEYRRQCLETMGLGDEVDEKRYGHLNSGEREALKWLVKRSTSCMWLPDSVRTRARAFKHRLLTKGPAV